MRARSASFQDHYSQATLFWQSLTPPEQEHLVEAAHFELGKVEVKAIRQRMVEHFQQIDPALASRVAAGIGIAASSNGAVAAVSKTVKKAAHKVAEAVKAEPRAVERSPTLSMENTVRNTIQTRRIAILAADGYNHTALMTMKTALESAGAETEVVSKMLGNLQSSSGESVEVDKSYLTTASIMYDAVFIPGGQQSVQTMQQQGDARHFVNEAFKHGKSIGAAGESVALLMAEDIQGVNLAGSQSVEPVIAHKGVVTSRTGADLNTFNQQFIQAIAQHRHWARQEKEPVPA